MRRPVQSRDADALRQYTAAIHDSDLPMYAVFQLMPEEADGGTEVARFLFTTAAEPNFVVIPPEDPAAD